MRPRSSQITIGQPAQHGYVEQNGVRCHRPQPWLEREMVVREFEFHLVHHQPHRRGKVGGASAVHKVARGRRNRGRSRASAGDETAAAVTQASSSGASESAASSMATACESGVGRPAPKSATVAAGATVPASATVAAGARWRRRTTGARGPESPATTCSGTSGRTSGCRAFWDATRGGCSTATRGDCSAAQGDSAMAAGAAGQLRRRRYSDPVALRK